MFIINDIIYVLFLYIFFDTIHGVQSGIIRGLGLQVYGSIYTLFCYYILGMPLALTFAFKLEMGVKGLWLGFSIASIILDIGFWAIISCPNWHKIAAKMHGRIKNDDKQANVVKEPTATPASNHSKYTPEARAFRRALDLKQKKNEGTN